MAVDGGYGEKGVPKFSPNGSPDTAVDYEAVGKFAAYVGNRVSGTSAERQATSTTTTVEKQAWEGLEFYETDTDRTYLFENGAWVLLSRVRSYEHTGGTMFGTSAGFDASKLHMRSGRSTATTTSAAGNAIISFGTPFPNGVFAVVVTSIWPDTNHFVLPNQQDSANSLSQFIVRVRTANGSIPAANTSTQFSWIAFGW